MTLVKNLKPWKFLPTSNQKVGYLREQMIEAAAEQDDTLMNKYLGGETLSQTRSARACASHSGDGNQSRFLRLSLKKKGVQPLLDGVIYFLPSPLDVPPVEGRDPNKEERTVIAKTTSPSPLRLSRSNRNRILLREVSPLSGYSGIVKAGETLLNPRTGKRERIQRWCVCTPTRALRFKNSKPAISEPASASNLPARAIRSVIQASDRA